ncbi:MAG TPA: hypothetical protein VE640_07090 [Candidatus Bathyarchaeia archaeon]|jgi:hypothetical protein|nr:hypothetical protein [Candidatus Bathyarchaeia archaeon]
MTGATDAIARDIHGEVERLSARIAAAGKPIRLMGGLAVWLVAPTVRRPPYARPYTDLDYAAEGGQRRTIGAFFEAAGYAPEKMFNALHGATRMNFRHPASAWTIDLLFDQLDMSHRIDLRGRLSGPGPTIELADLLLTKLQIWEINRKDLGDAICLLADRAISTHAATASHEPVVELERLTSLARADWGLCHTIERNLRRARELAAAEPPEGGAYDPVAAIDLILAAIDAVPKTPAWRLRARLGERVAWYQTPEEVRHEA